MAGVVDRSAERRPHPGEQTVTDVSKKAAADFARVTREIRESTLSSGYREDGGHFSFSVPSRPVSPATPRPGKSSDDDK